MSEYANLLPGVPIVESPLFGRALEELDWSSHERELAGNLAERGFAVFDFPDPEINDRIDRIKVWLGAHFQVDFSDPEAVQHAGDLRFQDAWRDNPDVRALAANPHLLATLGRLYGRAAFPFQTLNFPVGTQQAAHSDAVHFSSLPERFMCGVWIAFEDIAADAGPLIYYPGSHRWPISSNAMIGRRGWGSASASAQDPFEPVWQAMVAQSGIEPTPFLAKKGQALIWAANLLHGGSPRINRRLTRWSQVTHYYFDNCIYYTPAYSDEPVARLQLRELTDIATGETRQSSFLGERVGPPALPPVSWTTRLGRKLFKRLHGLKG